MARSPVEVPGAGTSARFGDEWVARLGADSPARDAAVAELLALLLKVARSEAHRRAVRLRIVGPEVDDIAQQAADDAVVAIIAKLGEFRGESRFTTWAIKFVIFEVAGKINRHAWWRAGVPLDAAMWERLPDRFGIDPESVPQARELLEIVRRCVEDELTERQRRVFIAIVVNAMPLDALVAELGSNRNAIYKTMFDARRKIRAAIATNGYATADGGSS